MSTFIDGPSGDIQTYFDTTVDEDGHTYDYSTNVKLFQSPSAGYRFNGLILFNVSSLAGKNVTSATLDLYCANDQGADKNVTLNCILAANANWVEACNWDYKDGAGASLRWAGDVGANGGSDAGCSVSGTDFNATPLSTLTIPNGRDEYTINTFTLNTAQVQAWVNGANYGLRITSDVAIEFRSSDYTTEARRPKLTVNYTEGSSVNVITVTVTANC